jgi:hypothetical protein
MDVRTILRPGDPPHALPTGWEWWRCDACRLRFAVPPRSVRPLACSRCGAPLEDRKVLSRPLAGESQARETGESLGT